MAFAVCGELSLSKSFTRCVIVSRGEGLTHENMILKRVGYTVPDIIIIPLAPALLLLPVVSDSYVHSIHKRLWSVTPSTSVQYYP